MITVQIYLNVLKHFAMCDHCFHNTADYISSNLFELLISLARNWLHHMKLYKMHSWDTKENLYFLHICYMCSFSFIYHLYSIAVCTCISMAMSSWPDASSPYPPPSLPLPSPTSCTNNARENWNTNTLLLVNQNKD